MPDRALYTLLALLVLALVAPHAVLADAQKGAQIARQWCANCHVIGGNPAYRIAGKNATPARIGWQARSRAGTAAPAPFTISFLTGIFLALGIGGPEFCNAGVRSAAPSDVKQGSRCERA